MRKTGKDSKWTRRIYLIGRAHTRQSDYQGSQFCICFLACGGWETVTSLIAGHLLVFVHSAGRD